MTAIIYRESCYTTAAFSYHLLMITECWAVWWRQLVNKHPKSMWPKATYLNTLIEMIIKRFISECISSKIDFQLFETSHNQQQLPHFQKHCLHVCCTTTWTRDNKQKTYWELRGHQAPSLLDYYTSIQKLGAARP